MVDDNAAIHEDFRKILESKPVPSDLNAHEALLFGESIATEPEPDFEIDSAHQGQEAVLLLEKSILEDRPYSIAFVDIRMPPGWDGVKTAGHLWEIDPRLQVVLCTAYSDYSWKEIVTQLKHSDRLLILKKPFDVIEINQLVCSLTGKWSLARQLETHLEGLEHVVRERTADLNSSLSMIKATLEATADGILVLNQDGITFNRRFLEMWKVPEELIDAQDSEKILDYVRSTIESPSFLQKFFDAEYKSHSADYEVLKFQDGRVFECCAQPQSLDDSVVGTVWSFRDVTKRVVLEQQLRQAQKMECVGQLAGGVAHDFNNMLTVIQGHAAILRDVVNETDKPSVEEILAASVRATNLTRQLLAFSRRQVMQSTQLDLRQVVIASSKMLHRLIGEHIQFDIQPGDPLPPIQADAGMLEQVLMNLAINSRDAMPDGGRFGVKIRSVQMSKVQAAQLPDATPGHFVCLEVSDTGSGIPPEDLPRVFEPFFTTKEVGKGTGLGLATVYGIIKQHQGWIAVDSAVGIGTTFRMYLPVTKSPIVQVPSPLGVERSRGGSETILVVEDEPTVRALAVRILRGFGYNVLEASSAVKALEFRRQYTGKIHLVLTDMVMPEGISGRELAERLRMANPQVKIIFTSGFSPEIFGKNLTLTQGCNFLQKPYPPLLLAKTIRDSLDRTEVDCCPYQ